MPTWSIKILLIMCPSLALHIVCVCFTVAYFLLRVVVVAFLLRARMWPLFVFATAVSGFMRLLLPPGIHAVVWLVPLPATVVAGITVILCYNATAVAGFMRLLLPYGIHAVVWLVLFPAAVVAGIADVLSFNSGT